MTLVVCKIIDDNLYMESDSMLVYYDKYNKKIDPQPRFCSIIKTAIIHPTICLSYAGKVKYAENAIAECLKVEIKENAKNIIEILIKANIESKDETQFAVGIITPKGPTLSKISNGKFEDYDKRLLYLGHPESYKLFEEKYNELIKSKSDKESLKEAFDGVIKNTEIKSVDHFHISVSIDKKICLQTPVFLYEMHTSIHFAPNQIIHFDKVGEWKDIPFGTAEKGATAVSYFISLSPKLHGVAVHFAFENKGILFCPQVGLLGEYFTHLQGKTIELPAKEFLDLIKEKYGIPMRGMAKHDDSAMIYLNTSDE